MLTTPEDLDAEAPQVNPMPRLKRVADVADGDYYPTAPYLTLALLAVEKFEGEIGEFACGQGHIAETLRRTIPNPVLASDKFYRGYGHGGIALEKILQAKGEKAVANTITNPPYAKGVIEDFIETCVKLSRHKCALLMRLGALEGAKRHRLYQRYPFARVHVFSDRPTFMPNRIVHPGELVDGKRVEGSIAYAWYVWDTSHTGEPIVRWISPQVTKSLQARSKEITADLEGRYALAA